MQFIFSLKVVYLVTLVIERASSSHIPFYEKPLQRSWYVGSFWSQLVVFSEYFALKL